MITHERILLVLSEMFPGDKTRPGVVSSRIEDTDRFYVSACRYEHGHMSKEVIAKATDSKLDVAMHKLGLGLLNLCGRRSTSELDKMEKEADDVSTRSDQQS